MSGLEMLPPDQRAVLQLIVKQGRGYAELAELLKIDPVAVRTRAHAGLAALAGDPGAGVSEPERAQIADYLLGMQDEGERIVTLAQLGESPAASRWARALRERLAPLAREPLPELPAPATVNGSALAPRSVRPQPPAKEAAREPELVRPRRLHPAARRGEPSRLGGAILLAAIALLAAIVAIVLISGGGDDGSPSAASRTSTTRSAPARTQPARSGAQTTGRVVAQVNLLPTAAGAQAVAVGLVQQQGSQRTIALRAQSLPANGADDIYAAWLQGPAGVKLLGYVQKQVKEGGTFTVGAPLPANTADYDTVLITRESITTTSPPTQPGEAILRGTLSLS